MHSANAAKEMGGRLDVNSEGSGHGATFRLELPLSGSHGDWRPPMGTHSPGA